MEKIRTTQTWLDKDWKPPEMYKETPVGLVEYWERTVRDSGGQIQVHPRSQLYRAKLAISKYGFVEACRVLACMASPLSSFYQKTYSLASLDRGKGELGALDLNKLREYEGFIGPIHMRELGDRNESQ